MAANAFSRARIVSGLALPSLLIATLAFGFAPRANAQNLEVVPDEILVGVSAASDNAAMPRQLGAVGTVVGHSSNLHAHRIKLQKGASLDAALAAARRQPGVLFAEPNHIHHACATPNDPSFSSQWAPQKVQADLAWGIWTSASQVVIAIVDTGIDNTHPDLTNKIYRDSSGIVGYDSFLAKRADAKDDHGHGTHCAGIAAAQINNNVGISGIAGWNGQTGTTDTSVKLMPIKVLDSSGSGTDSSVADGVTWAADHGAQVISLSLGSGGTSTVLSNAIAYAWGKGCVITAAAGNSGSSSKFYPAAYANVISVAATDSSDTLASFSNYGSWVSVAAPGSGIYSTLPTYAAGGNFGTNYGTLSGTSMATPHVAGEAALILSMNPSLTNAQVSSYITSNVDGYNPYSGRTIAAGAGRINVFMALKAANGITTAPSTAAFVGTDATTQGSWKGKYGAVGYSVVNDSTSLPSYASVSNSGANSYSWAASTTNTAALQKANSATDRIAACLYQLPGFSLDVNLTDTQTHKLSIYLMGWDIDRTQKVEILDGNTNAVLDTQSLSGFMSGKYATWTVKGHVKIRLSVTLGANAVVNGVFLDSATTSSNSATYVKTDTTTQGTWKGVYGAAGYSLVNESASLPSYATVSSTGANNYTWAASTTNMAALQKGNSTTDRIAACLYQSPNFTVDISLTDGNTHQISLYLMGWDVERTEKVEILDGDTGAVLDTQSLASFVNGKYLVWNVKGHIKARFTNVIGANAVLSGVFLD